MTESLGKFEGRKVVRTTIALKNAGDGLSKAQKVDPVLLHSGDTIYVVFETTVGKVAFPPLNDKECERSHDLVASAATIIDAAVVREALDAQKERIRIAGELAEGVHALPTPAALRGEHLVGDHDDTPVEGCPICEQDAETELPKDDA